MTKVAVYITEALTPSELEQAAGLFVEYAESFGWDLSAGRLAEEVANPPGPYAPPAGALLLACADGEPAGVLGLQPVPADVQVPGIGAERFGELKRLYVPPRFRRAGIARALVERAHCEARERGYVASVLTTSAELMPLAQGLYESLGYRPTDPYRTDLPWPEIRWLRFDL